MTTKTPEELLADASAWWDTSIIDIHPGKIAIRGYPIEELIGRVRFPDMIWLMLRGELPSRGQADLLEAAMVPGVDHGPHAPSIAIARMAVTCGLPRQRRDGLRHQRARRRPRRRRAAVHGALSRDRRRGRPGRRPRGGRHDRHRAPRRPAEDRAGLRPPLPPGRPACRAAARLVAKAVPRGRVRPLRRDRPAVEATITAPKSGTSR